MQSAKSKQQSTGANKKLKRESREAGKQNWKEREPSLALPMPLKNDEEPDWNSHSPVERLRLLERP